MRLALERGVALSELDRDDLAAASELLGEDYHKVFAGGGWLESKVSAGGTAQPRVREQLDRAREQLKQLTG